MVTLPEKDCAPAIRLFELTSNRSQSINCNLLPVLLACPRWPVSPLARSAGLSPLARFPVGPFSRWPVFPVGPLARFRCPLHREKYETHEHAVRAASDYIKRFHNPKRLHSALDYVSPTEFEQRMVLK